MRTLPFTLVVCLLLAGGCQQGPPPEPPVGPPAEDLSHWTVPALIQPEEREPSPQARKTAPRRATEAEKVYDYVPGGVYKVAVALDAPLDLILEPGEKVQALIGSDPKPIRQLRAPRPRPSRGARSSRSRSAGNTRKPPMGSVTKPTPIFCSGPSKSAPPWA